MIDNKCGVTGGGTASRVGVVLLNWNGIEDTRQAVRSVLAQTCSDLAIIVADNGSANDEAARLRGEFPEITVVENGANLGFCAGNNRGAERARDLGAQFLLFLNNDATVAPDAVARLVAAMESDASIGAASPLIFHATPPDKVWFAAGNLHLHHPTVVSLATEVRRTGALGATDWACGCALIIRTERFFELGGFDEDFFAYHEDVDLSLRLRKVGLRCVIVPDSHAWHVGSASTGGSFSARHLYLTTRNSCHLVRRHGTLAERLRFWLLFWPRTLVLVHALLVWDAAPERAAALLHGAVSGMLGRSGPMEQGEVARDRWRVLLGRLRGVAALLAAALPGPHRRLRAHITGTYLPVREAAA